MLQSEFIIFDTEFTAWEGSHSRNWSNKGEHRELIQLGAIKVNNFKETDNLLLYCRPVINPQLSDYIVSLTGVTQDDITTKGKSYEEVFDIFMRWAGELPIYSYGTDVTVLTENHTLHETGITVDQKQFHDVRKIFEANGVDTSKYHSGTIPTAFGKQSLPNSHDALNDARSILFALQAI